MTSIGVARVGLVVGSLHVASLHVGSRRVGGVETLAGTVGIPACREIVVSLELEARRYVGQLGAPVPPPRLTRDGRIDPADAEEIRRDGVALAHDSWSTIATPKGVTPASVSRLAASRAVSTVISPVSMTQSTLRVVHA